MVGRKGADFLEIRERRGFSSDSFVPDSGKASLRADCFHTYLPVKYLEEYALRRRRKKGKRVSCAQGEEGREDGLLSTRRDSPNLLLSPLAFTEYSHE